MLPACNRKRALKPDRMNTNSSAVGVRPAQPADSADILRLIDGLAAFEKLDPPDAAAKQRLIRDAFCSKPPFEVFLAVLTSEEGSEQVIGYAIVLDKYSSFLALRTLFLEDIFVQLEHRGCGAGYLLFKYVVQLASDRGCGRVEFVVLDWNTHAQEFYKRIGAEQSTEWLNYRVTREGFSKVLAG